MNCPVHLTPLVRVQAPVAGGWLLVCANSSCQQSARIDSVSDVPALPSVVSGDKAQAQKPSKYRAIATEVDGVRFASKKEAARYRELLLAERAGQIADLRLQVRYPITVNGHKICTYIGDFEYTEGGRRTIEDAKGMKTPAYILKCKLMLAVHGVVIKET